MRLDFTSSLPIEILSFYSCLPCAPDVPILFITTPGADPSQELSEYAQSSKMQDQYYEVAMGQGQAEKAFTLLRKCAREGEMHGREACKYLRLDSPTRSYQVMHAAYSELEGVYLT